MDNVDLLQQLMDNIEDNIFFKDSNSKFIMINQANARWFGLKDPREAIGKDDFDFFTHEHAVQQRKEEEWIMSTGKPVLCEEQADSRENYPAGWGSVTKLPLRDKDGNIIGTMGIGRDISELKRKEIELKRANDRIADDLKMAAKIQHAFLPQRYPSFTDEEGRPQIQFHHFYEADTELGGDFCSIYRLNSRQAGLLICDVMGHGVRAALITAIIHSAAQELVGTAMSPGEFLTALNQRLLPVLQTEDEYLFATAAYFKVDVLSGETMGAIAGHPPPFIIQPHSGRVSQLEIDKETMGPALAVVADYEYKSIHTRLEHGDKALFYTDGICEAMNASRDEFGERHLKETIEKYCQLPVDALIQQIVEVVKAYAEDRKPGDDICLLGFSLAT